MTTRLLSSLRRVTLAAEHARNVDLTIGDATDNDASTTDRENPTIGNEAFCRGLPLIGRGVTGEINGTNPEKEALR
jgi:hypothetical protein